MSDKKPVGRPPKGNDNRVTLRLSDDQYSTVCKYGRDYNLTECGRVNMSDVIRKMIDKFREVMVLSDNIDLATHNICVAADVLNRMAEITEDQKLAETAETAQQMLLDAAFFFHNEFSYEDRRPDIAKKAFLFERSSGGRTVVTEQERKFRKK